MDLLKPAPMFARPLMNAAGSLGFAPDARAGIPWEIFGAFVTNPISYRARQPARGKRAAAVPGGILLHTGHFNPGFGKAVKHYTRRWEQSPLPVIVHLLADSPREMSKMILKLETIENVIGVEIGFPADITQEEAGEVLGGAVGELSVIARVSLQRAIELAPGLIRAGASAVSLGPPRAAQPDHEGGLLTGRLYGPGVFPQTLYVTGELVRRGIPVIAAGGVATLKDAETLQAGGALAVQVDTALWRGDWLERGP